MIDRERVIKGLEHCAEDGCKGCPYASDCLMDDGFSELARDALELLKEQEPVPPQKVKRYVVYSDTAINFPVTYECGGCGVELPDNAKYCPGCGKAVEVG